MFAIVGCTQKPALQREVKARSADELASCRADLSGVLTPDQMHDFDTAIQELKLEQMNKGVNSALARDAAVRVAINGKTVQDALVLGWKARRVRLGGELQDMNDRWEHDSKLKTRREDSDSKQTLSNVVRNEQDIISQLKQNLADVDQHLASWGTSAGSASVPAQAIAGVPTSGPATAVDTR